MSGYPFQEQNPLMTQGIDPVTGVRKVQTRAYTPLFKTASGVIKSAPGQLLGFWIASFTSGATIKLWDNASAGSGDILLDTTALTTHPTGPLMLPAAIDAANGIYLTVTGTINIGVIYG